HYFCGAWDKSLNTYIF
nr:immunoglobulin light chain junction region [Macaca mulatta]MOW69928.1 immunoglobulin light chain junction region [Macaca mulatta]